MVVQKIKDLAAIAFYKRLCKKNSQLSCGHWDMAINGRDHLVIGGCDCTELTHIYGTPLHLVSLERLKKNYESFLYCFKQAYPDTEVFYSYKTNPVPKVLKILNEFGAGAEVISHFELWLALKLGVPSEKIIYNGPCKTEESLDMAIANRIKLINIDGMGEIEIIDRLAKRYGHKQQVGVRVITSVGWGSQFGLSIKTGAAFRAFERLAKLQNVIPCGLHIHLGTGIKNIRTYLQAIKEVLDLSIFIRKKLGINIKYFDFGGGFGVPTVQKYSDLDYRVLANNLPARSPNASSSPSLSEYGIAIIELFKKYYPSGLNDLPTLIFEPGRAITSSSQSLLLKVITIKPAENGLKNIIVDGGKNIAIPTSWEYHEVFAASKMNAPLNGYYRIFGPLCHPDDILFPAKSLPKLEPGDILAVMDAGAYFIPNQRNFSFPRPAVVLVEDGRHELIRERESFENIVALDRL
jgi:diaminopimelate decarboxylase